MAEMIRVQVCYAKPDDAFSRDLKVPVGACVEDAIRQSGILEALPEIDLAKAKLGIYGKIKQLNTVLQEHDRVEIYRPLHANPNQTRQRRAAKKESG